MKKLAIFTALLLLFGMFNACEEDEKNLLIGKWSFVVYSYEIYDGATLEDSGTSTDGPFLYLEFFKGGDGIVTLDEEETETFTWEKDGKSVLVNEGTVDEQNISIVTLTKDTLIFTMTMIIEEGGTTYTVYQTITMVRVEE